MTTQCYLLTKTDLIEESYVVAEAHPVTRLCPKNPGTNYYAGHHGVTRGPIRNLNESEPSFLTFKEPKEGIPWPLVCMHCGEPFVPGLNYDYNVNRPALYQDENGISLITLSEAQPGAMYYAPWYHDPASGKEPWSHLSIYYKRDWATKRPPIVVIGPNKMTWIVDSVSSNGNGWEVTGEIPKITCKPSIVLGEAGKPGYYHGWLNNGVFSDHVG